MGVDMADAGRHKAALADQTKNLPVRSNHGARQQLQFRQKRVTATQMTERQFSDHERVGQNPP